MSLVLPIRTHAVVAALALACALAAAPLRAQEGEPASRPAEPKVIVVGPGGTAHVEGGATSPAASAAAAAVRTVTPEQAAALVRRARGNPTVVVLYGAACSRSKALLPHLLALAERAGGAGGAGPGVLAFGVNGDADDYAAFHAAVRTTHDPLRIGRDAPGELSEALAPFGIAVPSGGYRLPFVAVLDANGRVAGQWEAATRAQMRAALETTASAFGVAR